MAEPRSVHEWLSLGIEKGWRGPAVCSTHDGIPSTAEEDAAFESGSDPCIFIVRPYYSEDDGLLVEENHPPSKWRR